MNDVICLDCGLPYDEFGIDTTVPNLQWEMIMGHEGGILCASCMVKRASKIPGVLAARMVFEIVPEGIGTEELIKVLKHWKRARDTRLNKMERSENLRCCVDIVELLKQHSVVVPKELLK